MRAHKKISFLGIPKVGEKQMPKYINDLGMY